MLGQFLRLSGLHLHPRYPLLEVYLQKKLVVEENQDVSQLERT